MFVSCGNDQSFRVAPASEGFLQHVTYNNKVDLLWVIDNSTSMNHHQQNLSNQFASFIDVLNTKKIDYNIAITTMDMSASGEKGKFIGTPKVITSKMSNAKELFKSNVLIGENGSDTERGLEAMQRALSPELLGSQNAGFLRDDAQLAVIFVTNEEDYSAGSVTNYADFLDSLKPGNGDVEPPKWMANFIGITQPNGVCFTRGEIADPGDRYMELADISNGGIAEICSDDLSIALTNIRKRIVERLVEFRLSMKPKLDSIRVSVNSVVIPQDAENGWTYEDKTAQGGPFVIRFHGTSVPAADARVRIDYQPEKAN